MISNAVMRYATIALIVCILVTAGAYALFHGSFDRANFLLLSQRQSSAGKTAMVAKRHDGEGYSSDQYFVLVGDHTYSSKELKHAYYHDGLIFRAGEKCLEATWTGPSSLDLSCKGASRISVEEIAVQAKRSNGIQVSYTNIPLRAAAK